MACLYTKQFLQHVPSQEHFIVLYSTQTRQFMALSLLSCQHLQYSSQLHLHVMFNNVTVKGYYNHVATSELKLIPLSLNVFQHTKQAKREVTAVTDSRHLQPHLKGFLQSLNIHLVNKSDAHSALVNLSSLSKNTSVFEDRNILCND